MASLQQLAAEERDPFDFIFVDANKDQLVEYVEWGIKLARPGALIIADNIVRDGEILNETSDDSAVQGVRRFYDTVSGDSRVNATAIQTVGAKGYDGFALLRVVTQ